MITDLLNQMEVFRKSVASPVKFAPREILIALRAFRGEEAMPVKLSLWGIAIGSSPPQYVLYDLAVVDEGAGQDSLSGAVVEVARSDYIEPRWR